MTDKERPFTQAEIIKLASKTAIEVFDKKCKEQARYIRKRYIDNTKKLLRGYRELQTHIDEAVSNTTESMPSQLQAVLAEVFDAKGFIKVVAIAQSKERTEVMLSHVDAMLSAYQRQCEYNNEPYFNVVWRYYINKERMDEIADVVGVDERTAWRYADKGIEDLSILLWGAAALATVQG